jgi:pimeloyl-ACP methyl ester carboxylesterase
MTPHALIALALAMLVTMGSAGRSLEAAPLVSRVLATDSSLHHQLYERTHTKSDAGNPAAIVVLIHGWSCDSSYWDAQLPALVAHHDVLTVDLAGHGRSPLGEQDGSMARFAADVASLLSELPPDKPLILAGHSMGGPVAIETAHLLGERVRGVIGVDTFASVTWPPTPAAEVTKRLAAFQADFAATTAAFVSQSFFRSDADPALKSRIVADMSAGNPIIGKAAIRGLNDWRGLERMRTIRAPIVTINADQVPIDVERIRSDVPQFRAITLGGLGHFLMMEAPQRFNPLLLATIDELINTD